MVVTHRDLTDRARLKTGSAVHVSVEDFMSSPRYDEIVEMLRNTNCLRQWALAEEQPTMTCADERLREDQKASDERSREDQTKRGPTYCPSIRSCWPAPPPQRTRPSTRPAPCWSQRTPSSRPTWMPCTSARSRCRPTWATVSPSRTAPTRPRPRSAVPGSRSCATPNPSTGTANRPSSWSESPVWATTTWHC